MTGRWTNKSVHLVVHLVQQPKEMDGAVPDLMDVPSHWKRSKWPTPFSSFRCQPWLSLPWRFLFPFARLVKATKVETIVPVPVWHSSEKIPLENIFRLQKNFCLSVKRYKTTHNVPSQCRPVGHSLAVRRAAYFYLGSKATVDVGIRPGISFWLGPIMNKRNQFRRNWAKFRKRPPTSPQLFCIDLRGELNVHWSEYCFVQWKSTDLSADIYYVSLSSVLIVTRK